VAGSEIAAAAASWAATRRVRVGGERIRYREAGEGVPVVLVHGLAMASDYWARTGPSLAAGGFRVLAPDLPGFGESPGPDDGLTVGAQAAALRSWADALELGPAVYIGHSLSCQTVVELAVSAPGRVRALVLAAPTGDGGGLRLLREVLGLAVDAWKESLRLLVLAGHAYLRAGPRRFWNTWRSGARHALLPLLTRVTSPTLVVVGDSDPVVSTGYAADLVERLPDGELLVVEGGTHAVFFHRPEPFNRAVLAFLRSRL
jgi:2-hydroxy-6-oxonona-2,4-dienedioate hydrolase